MAELQKLFLTEAAKYNVLLLDNSILPRLLTLRPSATAGQSVFTYKGENAGIPVGNAPSILDKDYTISAEVTVPDGGAEGMIATLGGRFGGYRLYLSRSFNWWFHEKFFKRIGLWLFVVGLLLAWLSKKSKWSRLGHALLVFAVLWVVVVFATGLLNIGRGKAIFLYNLLDLERFKWEGSALSAGKHTIVFNFKYDGPGPGRGGTGVLSVDGKEVDRKTIPHTIPMLMAIDETFDVGLDTRTPVDDLEYRVPFKFGGKIDKLTYNLGLEQLSAEDKEAVVGFENFLQSNKDKIHPELLAAKICGRWRNGVPLALSPETDSPPGGIPVEKLNDYEYVNPDGSGDPKGLRCPVGAHMRRINPRGQPVTGQGQPGGSNNTHRLIRPGMPYGPKYDPKQPYDGIERGLLGYFIKSSIENQYEFVLGHWVNDSEFAGAVRLNSKSKDLMIGTQYPAESIFVIPGEWRATNQGHGVLHVCNDQSSRLLFSAKYHGH